MNVVRLPFLALLFLAASLFPVSQANSDICRLCETPVKQSSPASAPEKPISIDITTRLNFSRFAIAGNGQSGQVKINPQSGSAQVQGGVVDLGGYSLAGTAVIRGEPGRLVRVDMPTSIQMTSSTGGTMTLAELQTDLGPSPRLDAAGELRFSFGGALQVSGSVSGKFRGRIPITVQYE
ncbi:MAG: DUF4402 domain-containing protein [Sphingomonadales bacterium]|nr:DUF4402 domain-containing protein [Sphingomonadales bacterium]